MTTPTTKWSRDELLAAFDHYQAQVQIAADTGNWELFANLFTEDATYIEHAYGTFHGREEIKPWIIKTMTTPPGSWMPSFPPSWFVVDEERGRIVCEIENPMLDPGDGSRHVATNITILTYAGQNMWSCEEDVYNPAKFMATLQEWGRAGLAAGGLPEGAESWLDAAMPGWRAS